MKILKNAETEKAKRYFEIAKTAALASPCYRSKCGAAIVSDGTVIGRGFNSPLGNQRLEKCLKDDLPPNFNSDKTCCVHAEQRALKDALIMNRFKLKNSIIYFARLDLDNNFIPAEKPYCTICSKDALDSGVKEWVLWHDFGIVSYDSLEYNEISFGLKKWNPILFTKS